MSVIQRSIQAGWQLRVFFTEDVFAPANLTLQTALADNAPRKALAVLDQSLAQAQPNLAGKIENYFSAHAGKLQLVRSPLVIEGGERAKNSYVHVSEIHSLVDRHHIDRHSYLIAIGGGALLDVAGLAAATAHRGLRHVRIPSTTLSQADSGVGVKNGINAFGKKNFIGTFAPPHAVINDFNLLATLEPRDKRAGYVEAVKVACIRDAEFFGEIELAAENLCAFEPAAMKRLIHRCAELHLDHIAAGGDPFETGSARPLDFGHWSAHKLEQLSNFQIAHGEAVAIGIALDVIYSQKTGLLDASSAGRILKLLEQLGFDLFANELLNVGSDGNLQVLGGLNEFREHLGGELTVTLLREIGSGVEVHEMNLPKVVEAIHELRERHAIRAQKVIRASA
ncbi:MAG TPA: 3-dehydroquinate synthase [Candidatus Baltobacteraceae bacterium]|nr:3-dehydroquinate synthase [Candidatus Baltobacteraceae bacterium]